MMISDTEKKERKKHGALFWFFMCVISFILLGAAGGAFGFFFEGGMYDSTKLFRKNVNNWLLQDYAVYALSDYQDDFGMEELKNTNFRYGVYSTDDPASADLEKRSTYEVCNFSEDVLSGSKSDLFRYSATLGEYSVFRYNIDSLFRSDSFITNYSSYGYDNLVWEEHRISHFVYIWNTESAYVITSDGYYFPVWLVVRYDDEYEERDIKSALNEDGDDWSSDALSRAKIIIHADNGDTITEFPSVVSIESVDYLADYVSGTKYNYEEYTVDFTAFSINTGTIKAPDAPKGKDCYLIAYVQSPLNMDQDDLFVRVEPWVNFACSVRYPVAVLAVLFLIAFIISCIMFLIRFFSLIAGGIKKLSHQWNENVGLLWRLIGICILCTLAEFIVLVVALGGGAEELVVIGWFVQTLVLAPLFIFSVLQLNKISKGARRMVEGKLDASIDTSHMFFDLKKIGNDINSASAGLENAVEERMKSERFKTELISNVSHDIKTPLTSIISYVELLKNQPSGEPANPEYLDTLERQSVKLKKLLEDLIEASKASTGNLKAEMEPCNVNMVVHQVIGEYEEKLAASSLDLRISVPEEPINIMADSKHLQRVLDNLLTNVSKYAQPGTRVYVNLSGGTDNAVVEIKNTSREPLNMTSDELMERFARGDSSRGSEGNGLGLSIAQSLMEIMNGQFRIVVDGDLFKAIMLFPRITNETQAAEEPTDAQTE